MVVGVIGESGVHVLIRVEEDCPHLKGNVIIQNRVMVGHIVLQIVVGEALLSLVKGIGCVT